MEAQGILVGYELSLQNVGQVKEVSTAVQDRPDFALQIAHDPGEEGGPGHPTLEGNGGELIHLSP